MLRVLLPRTACPLCGARNISHEREEQGLLDCRQCGETLYPSELVRVRTRWTRLAYNRANNHSPAYGTPNGPGN